MISNGKKDYAIDFFHSLIVLRIFVDLILLKHVKQLPYVTIIVKRVMFVLDVQENF